MWRSVVRRLDRFIWVYPTVTGRVTLSFSQGFSGFFETRSLRWCPVEFENKDPENQTVSPETEPSLTQMESEAVASRLRPQRVVSVTQFACERPGLEGRQTNQTSDTAGTFSLPSRVIPSFGRPRVRERRRCGKPGSLRVRQRRRCERRTRCVRPGSPRVRRRRRCVERSRCEKPLLSRSDCLSHWHDLASMVPMPRSRGGVPTCGALVSGRF
jgi:hypothetical protein